MQKSLVGGFLPVIGLVLTILLVATILATSILHVPGRILRQMKHYEQDLADMYLGESAIVAWLEQFPPNYFSGSPWNLELPSVEEEKMFPWSKVSAVYGKPDESSRRIATSVGASFRTLGRDELRHVSEQLVANLNREILGRNNLKNKSGSRRLSGVGENISLNVTAGDLTLEFDGNVESVNIKCDGDVKLRGTAKYDTLRLYVMGNVDFAGSVSVRHLEVFSGGKMELSRSISFSGVIYSSGGISFRGKSRVKASSDCADTTGGGVHLVSVSPEGCLLPAVVGGHMVAFDWRLE